MRREYFASLVILLVALQIGGCASNTKPYRADLPQNLEVISNIESVEAVLHIYSSGKQCESVYLGSVNLDRNSLQLGIDSGRPSHLVIGFSSSSFWSSSSGYIDYGVTFVPGKAYHYEIDVSYNDSIYNITVNEINRANGSKREMQDSELQNCNT